MGDKSIPLLSSRVHICLGTVIDMVLGLRWYNVRIGNNTDVQCSAVYHGNTDQVIGAKQIGMYAAGTHVLVMLLIDPITHVPVPPGYILGSVMMPAGSTIYRILDSIGLATGADCFNDITHSHTADKQPDAMRDFNNGVPLDAIPGSDYGRINELGVGSGISRFYSWMRASELSGLWCFYLDNLTRLAAYNYEFWHAGGERYIKNDEGEVNDVDLFTPYPWEASGVLEYNKGAVWFKDKGGKYIKGQFDHAYEPKEVDQTMIPRWMRLRGYVGDAHREMVILPAIEPVDYKLTAETFVERTSRKTKYTGLLDIHQHASGLYSIRSAQGIVLEKYIHIPVPKQVHAPEDSDTVADGATNYRPAGIWGPDDASLQSLHNKQPWPWTDATRPDTWAAELFDYSAFMFNWYNMKPLLAHTKDWWVPDEGYFANQILDTTTGKPVGLSGVYMPEKKLTDTFNFPLPQFAKIKIDHRTGNTKYFYSRSIIAQLPDGSVLIEDGYGSSVYMTGGNIHVSAAGDVWTRSGRSIVMWAGDDLIARAGSSVDISASNADVRIKAQRNLHMLGGNGTDAGAVGGIIIESRAAYGIGSGFKFRDDDGDPLVGEDVNTYGIILKSVDSPVMIYGRDIYGRSAISSGGGGTIEFEADADIVISGTNQTRYSNAGFTDIIGQLVSAGGSVLTGTVVNKFDKAITMFSSTDLFRAQAAVVILDSPNGLYARGPIAVNQGIVPFPDSTIDAVINGYSADYITWLAATLPAVLAYYYDDLYTGYLKSNTSFISEAGFTCRDESQYGLTLDFLLPESRWQQTYRANDIGIVWYEPAVLIPGLPTQWTRPHPGDSYWIMMEKYLEYDHDLWQWKSPAGDWALCDIERSTDSADSGPYVVASNKRVDGTSTAQKARFLGTNYLISKQYGQP